MIRTTINITYEVYTRLLEEAEAQGMEIEALIIAMLQHFSKKHRKEIIVGDSVQYQERRPEGSYVRVHVNWFVHEYEFLIDLRKVHKKSVSRLIAENVMAYLTICSIMIDSILDKYEDRPYVFSKIDVHDVLGCIFLWGYPLKKT
jgi:hypothetical protein